MDNVGRYSSSINIACHKEGFKWAKALWICQHTLNLAFRLKEYQQKQWHKYLSEPPFHIKDRTSKKSMRFYYKWSSNWWATYRKWRRQRVGDWHKLGKDYYGIMQGTHQRWYDSLWKLTKPGWRMTMEAKKTKMESYMEAHEKLMLKVISMKVE